MPRGSFRSDAYEQPKAQQPVSGQLVSNAYEIGTEEQKAIWNELLKGDKHVIVEAVAGSGKTWTITEYAKMEKHSRIGLTAFNKHIATELTQRMNGQVNVECMTYHSLGFNTVKANYRGRIDVDKFKVLSMLDDLNLPVREDQERTAKYKIASMVGYAKTYGHGPDVERDALEKIADRHDLDMNGLVEVVMDYTPKILKKCMAQMGVIDFDDMIWLPYVLGMSVKKYDVLCVDEYQDTSFTQQWLAVRGRVRVCAVGDPRQAIYSFRGCDGTGFAKLRTELGSGNVKTFPLSLTRRCPKAHVRLAQMIVPQIKALPDAAEGVVRVTRSVDEAVGEMKPGDLVVCRVNAELVGVAYKLLKRGVKAIVRGRDIGKGMTKLIEQAVKNAGSQDVKLSEMVMEAGSITNETVAKFMAMPNGRGEMRAANAQDKYECLCELTEGCRSVSEVRSVIERLFAEFEDDGKPKEAVVLGTVHRTKGLEAARVYVLRPDLIPHPMAKKEEDWQSELNLAYVAVTRAKFGDGKNGELVFVGGECGLFGGDIGDVRQRQGKGRGKARNEPISQPEKEFKASTRVKEVVKEAKEEDKGLERWLEEDLGGSAVPEHRRWKN